MPFKVADRIQETSTTAGVGTYTLAGASVGYQAFNVLGANNQTSYFATDGTNWEVGIGTVLTAPNRLQRDTILASSNAGAAVNWSGATTVFLRSSMPAAGIAAKRLVSKAVGGGAGTTILTQDEQRRDVIILTGVLTGDRIVEVDATEWTWPVVFNNTTGDFTLTFRVTGQAGVKVPQKRAMALYCDGVDIFRRGDAAAIESRNANTALGAGDFGKRILASGTFSQTLDAVATLGDGWWVEYCNAGTGVITVDPNGAETIDGVAAIQIRPGESFIIVSEGSTLHTTGRGRAGAENLIINGGFSINQRAPATSADDTYAHDQWYVLTQSNPIAVSTLANVEDGMPFMARLTQSNAAAQRMGYAQIIEGKNCKRYRGKTVTFRFGRVRISASQPIRYAVLEWTGTEDAVVSDVVNDWASGDYTDGAARFFVDANIIPTGNTAHTPAAATLTDGPSLTVTLGSAFNNLILIAWTEGVAAQNVTLDLGRAKLEPGPFPTDFEYRAHGVELALCQRYLVRGATPFLRGIDSVGAGGVYGGHLAFPVEMRTTPTMSTPTTPAFTNASAFTYSGPRATGVGCHITTTGAVGSTYQSDTTGVYQASAEL